MHAARFRSDHLVETHAFIARYDGTHRRTALAAGPLGYSVHARRSGTVDIGWTFSSTRQKIRGVPRSAIIHEEAQRLLRSSTVPVCEIASRLGYGDTAAFTRAFRQWSGCSAREWRGRSDLLAGAL